MVTYLKQKVYQPLLRRPDSDNAGYTKETYCKRLECKNRQRSDWEGVMRKKQQRREIPGASF